MKLRTALVCLAPAVAALALTTVTAVPAQAITWRTAPATTAPAYDYNGYKALLKPSGFTIPRGYVDAGSVLTVKNSAGRVLARAATTYRAAPGVYTEFSTFKYRSKTPYTAYKQVSVRVTSDTCTITAAAVTDTSQMVQDPAPLWTGTYTVRYTLSCTGRDADGVLVPGTFVAAVSEDEVEYVGVSAPGLVTPDRAVGETIEPVTLTGTLTRTVAYTAYRYGAVKTVYVKRSVTVKKRNTGFVTSGEWRRVRNGMTPTTVASILGQSGYRFPIDNRRVMRAYINCFNSSGRYIGSSQSVFESPRCTSWKFYFVGYLDGRVAYKAVEGGSISSLAG